MSNLCAHSVSLPEKKVSLNNMFVSSGFCLHPKNWKSKNTVKQIVFLAKQLPYVIDETRISQLKDSGKFVR